MKPLSTGKQAQRFTNDLTASSELMETFWNLARACLQKEFIVIVTLLNLFSANNLMPWQRKDLLIWDNQSCPWKHSPTPKQQIPNSFDIPQNALEKIYHKDF